MAVPIPYRPNQNNVNLAPFRDSTSFGDQGSSLTATVSAGPGIDGFVFDIDGDYETTLTSDITDHYVEDNTAIQDHIALRPVYLYLKGYIGELVDFRAPNIQGTIGSITQKLSKITQLVPSFLPGADYARNALRNTLYADNLIKNALSSTKNYNSFLQGLVVGSNRQEEAYKRFEQFWLERRLMSVETPFGTYDDMVIETLSAKQKEESKYITDFSVVLKQIRTARSDVVDFDLSKFQETAGQQRLPQADNGKIQGQAVPKSDKSLFKAGIFYIPGLLTD